MDSLCNGWPGGGGDSLVKGMSVIASDWAWTSNGERGNTTRRWVVRFCPMTNSEIYSIGIYIGLWGNKEAGIEPVYYMTIGKGLVRLLMELSQETS